MENITTFREILHEIEIGTEVILFVDEKFHCQFITNIWRDHYYIVPEVIDIDSYAWDKERKIVIVLGHVRMI